MILNSLSTSRTSASMPMSVEIPVTQDFTAPGSASILNGYLTGTLAQMRSSMTVGYQNDLHIVEEAGGNQYLKIQQAGLEPAGVIARSLRATTQVYLNEDKTAMIDGNYGMYVSVNKAAGETLNMITAGSLQISGKIASNFASANYADFTITRPSLTAPLEMIVKTNYVQDTSVDQWLVSPFVYVSTNKKLANFTTAAVEGTTVLTTNTDYWIRIVWDGTNVNIYSKVYVSGETIAQASSFVWTYELTVPDEGFTEYSPRLGNNIDLTYYTQYWRGTVDLNNFKFYSSSTEIWDPYLPATDGYVNISHGNRYIDEDFGYFKLDTATKYYIPSFLVHTEDYQTDVREVENFSIIGRARVENKIASNMSASDFIRYTPDSTISMSGKTWEAVVKFKLQTTGTYQELLRVGSGIMLRTSLTNTFNIILFTSSSQILNATVGTFNTDEWTWLKVTGDPSAKQYTFYSSTDGESWTMLDQYSYATFTPVADVDYINVGSDAGTTYIGDPSSEVDLSETYFAVDGAAAWSPFVYEQCKLGYVSLIKPTASTTSAVVAAMRNPPAEYVGSVCIPMDMQKEVWMTTDLTQVIGGTDLL